MCRHACATTMFGLLAGSAWVHSSHNSRTSPRSGMRSGQSSAGTWPRPAASRILFRLMSLSGQRPVMIVKSKRPSEKMSALGLLECGSFLMTSGAIQFTVPPRQDTCFVRSRLKPKSSNLAWDSAPRRSTTTLESLISPWMIFGCCACRKRSALNMPSANLHLKLVSCGVSGMPLTTDGRGLPRMYSKTKTISELLGSMHAP
mmetsp:Transcript_124250/g.322784  ORF Transcript_124250/g.322784 Transcript_124250/m.322784 type:complete len:202 (-) Transcript_124250:841-1446(-)